MSKKNKRGKTKDRFSELNVTPIVRHKKIGSLLQPPLNRLPGGPQVFSSWIDDHMPEMLWAALIGEVFERDQFLGCMREIISVAAPWFASEKSNRDAEVDGERPVPTAKPVGASASEDYYNDTRVLDHTTIATLDDGRFAVFVNIIRRHPLGPAAIRPLLLIDELPGVDRWRVTAGLDPTVHDWQTLGLAVANVLDHQSQRSTDIRWFKLLFRIQSGGMLFDSSLRERVREYFEYPDRGDLPAVQASIRSAELMLRRRPASGWIGGFWSQASAAQDCIDPSQAGDYVECKSLLDRDSIIRARMSVILRFHENRGAERIDARLDATFGLTFYSLSIAEEIASSHSQSGLLGRLALRALVEAVLTMGYLTSVDVKSSWMAYRTYGNAQAKLAFLKAQEAQGDLPKFLEKEALYAIASEDSWLEFVDIELGDWEKLDNRRRAEKSGMKDIYDKYYGWASAFTHANWGAVRDTNFVTCHNPLHRLHRIPRLLHRTLTNLDCDVVELVNLAIARLDDNYKGAGRLSLIEVDDMAQ